MGDAGLVLADRYADLWHGYQIGAGHAFPDVHELEAWLRFLGTQCTE